MRTLYLLAGVFALSLAASASAEPLIDGDPEAGQEKSTTCTACHGADGNSSNPQWPKLAGQHAQYTFEQLMAYRNGERNNPVMSAQVRSLSEDDMRDLAAYYAEQTLQPGAADPELAELGESLYRGGNLESGVTACTACHGPQGKGIPMASFPRIGGQHATYIIDQLNAYRDGTRSTDRAAMMRDIASRMTDEEIRAVAEYIQGLY